MVGSQPGMQAIGPIPHQTHVETRLDKALLEVIPGFRFILDNQYFHLPDDTGDTTALVWRKRPRLASGLQRCDA